MSKRGPRLRGGDHKGSDRSKHTRSPGYTPGDNWLVCDVCGCHVYSSDALQRWDGMVVCKQDWEPRHEQDFVRARKDKLIPDGLLRPEPEDDFTTIPGISGPDPIPPPPEEAGIFHDFSKDQLGKFNHVRASYDTVLDHNGVDWAIGNNVPSLTGYQWDGVSKYTDVGKGQGIRTKIPTSTLAGSYILGHADELGVLPKMAVNNNYCGQTTCTILEDFLFLQQISGWGWVTFLALTESRNSSGAGSGGFDSLTTFGRANGNPYDPGGSLATRLFLNGVSEEYKSGAYPTTAVAGDVIDIRYRKSDGTQGYGDNGFTVWHYLNGSLVEKHTATMDMTGSHAGELGQFTIGSPYPRDTNVYPDATGYLYADSQFVRYSPTAESDETIEAWPTWVPPEGT